MSATQNNTEASTTADKTVQHPLPWSEQNGAIYDATDNGHVQNVRLCNLVISSTAVSREDAALIVRSVNAAPELLQAMRDIRDCMAFPEKVEGDLRFRVLSVATAAITLAQEGAR